jgi:hypothetical protein
MHSLTLDALSTLFPSLLSSRRRRLPPSALSPSTLSTVASSDGTRRTLSGAASASKSGRDSFRQVSFFPLAVVAKSFRRFLPNHYLHLPLFSLLLRCLSSSAQLSRLQRQLSSSCLLFLSVATVSFLTQATRVTFPLLLRVASTLSTRSTRTKQTDEASNFSFLFFLTSAGVMLRPVAFQLSLFPTSPTLFAPSSTSSHSRR